MDSDFQQQQYQHHFQDPQKQFPHQKQQLNTLTRFRSAPSSYFASFLDAADTITASTASTTSYGCDLSNTKRDFTNVRPLSPETENIFARFMSSIGDGKDGNNSTSQKLSEIPENSQIQPEFMVRVKQETDTLPQPQQHHQQQQQGSYNTSSPMMYQSASKPPLANHHSSASAMSSIGMNPKPQMRIGVGGSNSNNSSSLTRHSSSPAGFFDNLNIDGYGVLKGMGTYGGSNTSNDQANYSSGQPSTTSGLVRQTSGIDDKIMRMNSLEETKFSHNQSNDSNYNTGLPMSSWDDSILSDPFSRLDGGDEDRKLFSDPNSSENQTGESRNRLAHHLSLPNPSTELSAMERLLNLQDAVPLRIRAKRGCATHPRSIAERVRRTKISERMRKLQDLVPNMDKQTNTADMLDLAVDYIKDLQKQVTTLHSNRAKCTCPR